MKKPKPPSIVTIAAMTLITVVFWTFFGVFRIFTSKSPTDVPESVLKPINASLDTEALDTLGERNYLEPNEIPEIIYSTPEPIETEEQIITPEDTTSSELLPNDQEESLPETSPEPIPQDENTEVIQGAI